MSNLAHALPDAPASIFDGDWISRLDAISQQSFFANSSDAFLEKFSAHAHERGITSDDFSSMTNTVFTFIQKQGYKPVSSRYWRDIIDGGVAIDLAIDCPPDLCRNMKSLLIHEIVTKYEDFFSDLVTFGLVSSPDYRNAIHTI